MDRATFEVPVGYRAQPTSPSAVYLDGDDGAILVVESGNLQDVRDDAVCAGAVSGIAAGFLTALLDGELAEPAEVYPHSYQRVGDDGCRGRFAIERDASPTLDVQARRIDGSSAVVVLCFGSGSDLAAGCSHVRDTLVVR